MAQTGYTPILIYSSSTTTNAPSAGNLTNSTLGSELAINITDGKLFYKDNANAVQVIAWKTTPTTAGGTGLTSYTAGDLLYYATGTTLSKLAIGASTTILTSSGTAPQWSAASGITVGTATNIAGGAAGSVPYQSGAGATTFVSIGSAYQALQVNAGGTAPSWQASATSTLTAQGDLLYASAANTLARLAKNTSATRYLSNTGSSNNPAWAQVDLTNGVTGTLPTTNGGTGLTSFTANGVLYASSTSALTTGTGLQYSGSNVFSVNVTTPSTFSGSGVVGFQIGGAGNGLMGNSGNVWANQNVYFNSGFKKTATGYATLYNQSGGQHIFSVSNAGAGSAGDAITWTDFLTSQTNGDVTLNVGNLVIGTSGKGIDFSATPGTGTSELLADYEEGTWTGTLKGSVSDPTTPVTATGNYVKVGTQVFFRIIFSNVNTTGASGDVTVTGLPYTPSGRGVGSCLTYIFDLNGGSSLVTYIENNSTTLEFLSSVDDAAWAALKFNAGSGRYIWASGSYITT